MHLSFLENIICCTTFVCDTGFEAGMQERLISDSREYCVVNKPPCVPSVPVVSNAIECCAYFAGQVSRNP